jgi:hypothetical protein
MKTHNTVGLTAKKALLEGPYRPAVDTLLASYPEGISGEDLLAKVGFSSAKGLGGYMTGFRKQCRIAGIPEDPVITERKKNGGGTWRNYFRLSERAAEILKKWLEG